MPLSPLTIRQQIEATLLKINMQIDEVEDAAVRRHMMPIKTIYPDGRYILADLLVAKANLLNALVTLEATDRIKNL